MPRNNKKTRIKGLPPKLQLDQRDNTSGSYPTSVKIASDNRTGKYNVFRDDNNTIVFDNVSDIRDAIINYYRFNSGSTSNEVTPNPVVDGTASFLIRPTFSNTASLTVSDPSVAFTFQMHVTGTEAGFYTSSSNPAFLPWFGPDYDPNLSSINYYQPDYSFATGGLNIFNPGKTTAVSGAAEKPFSVAFWVRNIDLNIPGIILSVARTNANWTAGIVSNASFVVEGGGPDLQVALFDTVSNAIGIKVNNALPKDIWRHVVFTYDGSTTFDGMNLYLDGKLASTKTFIFQGTLGAYGGMQTSYADDIVTIGALGKRKNTIFGGIIDEMIFFNRVLNPGEIHDLYLSRVSIHTPSVENRFANGVYLGAGLPTNSPYWYNTQVDDLITDFSTSLYQAGAAKKGVGDSLAHFTPGQSFQPFKDLNNPAADAKSTGDEFYATGSKVEEVGPGFSQPLWSKTKIEIDLSVEGSSSFSTFYSSSGAEGFVSGTNYPMAYYNFNSKKWEGIGVGRPLRGGGVGAKQEFAIQGFTAGLVNFPEATFFTGSYNNLMSLFFEFESGAGRVTDKYGFPFAPRYHGTSSQLYPLSGVINEPFLVEKIVFDFSGSLTFDPQIQNGVSDIPEIGDFVLTAAFVPAAISNFFILNQRRPYNLQYTNFDYVISSFNDPKSFTFTIPTSSLLSSGSTRTRVDTVRDIVTHGAITSFASNMLDTEVTRSADAIFVNSPNLTRNPKSLMRRDINIETGVPLSNSLGAMNWSGRFRFELPTRSPNSINIPFTLDMEGLENQIFKNAAGGRNNLGVIRPSGRDLRSPISTIQTTIPTQLFGADFVLAENGFDNPNPYLLLPSDQLIFGWQQPIMLSDFGWSETTTGTGSNGGPIAGTGILSTMTMTGPAKVILYGSQIKSGEEFHDTLNQLLATPAIHEIIE